MPLLPSSPRERRLVIVFAVIVVLAGGFLVLRSGGGEPDSTLPSIPGPVITGPTPTLSPSPDTSASPTDLPEGRNPFAVLIAAAPTDGTTPTPTATETSFPSPSPSPTGTSPFPSPSPTDTGSPSPTPTPTVSHTSPPPGGAEITIYGEDHSHSVRMIDIFTADGTDWAEIEVDETIMIVSVGQEFYYTMKFVSVDGPCGNFLHGEEPFSICEPGA